MDQIEQLPSQLSRRNWIVLAVLLFASLPFGNLSLTLGILAGGLVAIAGFLWLRRSLGRLLELPGVGGARFRFQFGYIVRLTVLVGILAVLVKVVKIHAVGLFIGLSVVVVNLFWITAQRAFK